MESVAKSVQGPIKILFVNAWADPTADPPTKIQHSLLGLGDIVVPGEGRLSYLPQRLARFYSSAFVEVGVKLSRGRRGASLPTMYALFRCILDNM